MAETLFDTGPEMKTKALAPWFGSNRMLAPIVGAELGKLDWAGVVFSGGMAEVPEIKARALLVNDLHRDIINLARVIAQPGGRLWLAAEADALMFHPDELADAQQQCQSETPPAEATRARALAYFVAVWMGRSAKAGTDDELNCGLAVRYTASGGGSNVRYRSAIESLAAWEQIFKRCEFTVQDFREFLADCHDRKGHGIYCDPPFPGAGDGYRHKFTPQDHRDLAAALSSFKETRVVARFYDHPLIRELYPESRWTWRHLKGRDQANNDQKREVLLINGHSYAEAPNV